MLRRAIMARRPAEFVVRNAFAAEPLQPSIQLSPALRMLKTSLIPLMTPLERSESWEVQQHALHQRLKREKELPVDREHVPLHWSSWYQRCLAERPILTKVQNESAICGHRAHARPLPAGSLSAASLFSGESSRAT